VPTAPVGTMIVKSSHGVAPPASNERTMEVVDNPLINKL